MSLIRFDKDAGNLPKEFFDDWRVYAESEDALKAGEFYISVTTLLSVVADRDFVSFLQVKTKQEKDKIFDEAANHGSEIHTLIQKSMDGEECELGEYEKPVSNFLELCAKNSIEIADHEIQVHSDYGYAGSMDFRGTIGDKTCAIEFKSGKYLIQAGWQLAAYYKAYEEITGETLDCMIGIQCHRNGEDKNIFRYRHIDSCFVAFLSAMNVFRMIYFNKLKKLNWKFLMESPVEAV